MKPKQETVVRADPAIVHVSTFNTRQPLAKQVAELKKSIGEVGQTTPGLARPHPDQPGHYELAAGARRRLACELLAIPFDVIVREMTDGELLDIILVENLQREDPDPEREAELIQIRLDEGFTPSAICARYGKPPVWIERRMMLLKIEPALKKKMQPGKELAHFSTDMRERIGALDKEVQSKLAENWNLKSAVNLSQLQEFIRRLARSLEGCDYLDDPDTFVAGCGPGCATDTNASLFPEPGKSCGNCVNADCFLKRRELAINKAVTVALDGRKITDFVLIGGNYEYPPGCAVVHYGGKAHRAVAESLEHWEFKEVYKIAKKESDSIGLDLTDPLHPKILNLTKKIKDQKKTTSGGGSAEPVETREDKLTGKRLALMNKELVEAIAAAEVPAEVPILNIVAAFGMSSQRQSSHCESEQKSAWGSLDSPDLVPVFSFHKNEKRTRAEVIWKSVKPVLTTRLFFQTNRDLVKTHKLTEMRRMAGLINFDWEARWLKACAEIPVPKSWGKDIDPITLESTKQPAEAPPEPVKSDAKKAAKKPAKKAVKKTVKKAKTKLAKAA